MPIPVLRDRKRARDTLKRAEKRGTRETLLQNVTKDAIEKAHKKGDLDAKFRAVDNAAALEDVEEWRRDAAAAGEEISTEDATAAFLVAQRRGADAQEEQQRANAAEDQQADYKQQTREVGTWRRAGRRDGASYRVDGKTVQKEQDYFAAHRAKMRARGDTQEVQFAAPDTHHSLDNHGDWVGTFHANVRDRSRQRRKSVREQLDDMGIESLGDVMEIVEEGSIVGFKVQERLLPSWEGVSNPMTTFKEATANAARVREMPEARRRRSEMAEEREKAGKPHHCNPQENGKWIVTYWIGGTSRQIRDLKTGEHLLEKGAAVDLRDEYEKHVAEGRNGKCPCARKDRCPWLVPPKRKKRRRS